MNIYLVQMEIARGKPALNRAKVQALTSHLQPEQISLLVLPELFSTGYLDTNALKPAEEKFWESIPGDDFIFLSTLAKKLKCWVAGCTVEKGPSEPGGNGGFRNLSLLISPDGIEMGRYRKIHPFSFGGEDRLFLRGDVTTIWNIPFKNESEAKNPHTEWIVQPTICYDLRFPELYRAGSESGAQLILVQANWPSARQMHWETLLRARAIENQAFVAGVNCTGTQGALEYSGGTMLISPKGEILSQSQNSESLVYAKLDLDQCKQWRKLFPALRDRMPTNFWLT